MKQEKFYEFYYIHPQTKEKKVIWYGIYKRPELSSIRQKLKKEFEHDCFEDYGFTTLITK